MGGDEREIYFSFFRIGAMQERLGFSLNNIVNSYLGAYQSRPFRLEPLYYLANYFFNQGCYFLTYLISKFALTIEKQDDFYFTQYEIYDYGLLVQLSESSYRINRLDETQNALRRLRFAPNCPPNLLKEIENICINRFY